MERRITLAPGTAQHFNQAVSPDSVRTALGFGAGYTADDISALLAQGIEFVEGLSGMILRKASYEVAFNSFPEYGSPLVIPGIVQGLSTIRYLDTSGELETLVPADYETRVTEPRKDMLVFPQMGATIPESWPAQCPTYSQRDGVIATITGGADYSMDNEDIPSDLKAAVLHAIRWIHDENIASKSIAVSLARKFVT